MRVRLGARGCGGAGGQLQGGHLERGGLSRPHPVQGGRTQLPQGSVAPHLLQVQRGEVLPVEGELHDGLVDLRLQVAAVAVAQQLSGPHLGQLPAQHQAGLLGGVEGVVVHGVGQQGCLNPGELSEQLFLLHIHQLEQLGSIKSRCFSTESLPTFDSFRFFLTWYSL